LRNEATRNDEYPPAPGSALVGWGDLSDCVCGMDSLVLSRFARRDVLVGIGRRVISGSLGVRAVAAEPLINSSFCPENERRNNEKET
jgi:hypothetical protein